MYCVNMRPHTILIRRVYADQAVKYNQQFRHESTLVRVKDPMKEAHGPGRAQWNKVISDAEKLVEFPKSFVNLKSSLGDNVPDVIVANLKKLTGMDHPLLKTAKDILYKEHDNLQPWGLIILLFSKAIGYNGLQTLHSKDMVGGVLETQRSLAQITEMLRTSNLFHKGIVNVSRTNRTQEEETIMIGNKIGLLTGDYLLVTANEMLANIRKPDVSLLMFSAYRDLSEAEFLGDRDCQNFPVPATPTQSEILPIIDHESRTDTDPLCVKNALGNAEEEWTVHHTLSGGSLLGRSCQGAMLLAEQPQDLQKKAYAFGCHLALAWQASHDLHKLNCEESETFSLISAPVLYALQCDHDIYSTFIEPARADISHVDYSKLREAVRRTTALDKTKCLLDDHSAKARDILKTMGNNKAIDAIDDIISAM